MKYRNVFYADDEDVEKDWNKIEVSRYEPLVQDIKELIHKKQYHVLQIMNAETINLYWEIGEEIYR